MRLGGGGEEGKGGGRAEDGVEVDAGPGRVAGGKGEHDEGVDGEGEGKLGGEVGEDVVVALGGEGPGAVGGHEEGAEEAAAVF